MMKIEKSPTKHQIIYKLRFYQILCTSQLSFRASKKIVCEWQEALFCPLYKNFNRHYCKVSSVSDIIFRERGEKKRLSRDISQIMLDIQHPPYRYLTFLPTYLPSFLPSYLPTYLPTYLPPTASPHPHLPHLSTCPHQGQLSNYAASQDDVVRGGGRKI